MLGALARPRYAGALLLVLAALQVIYNAHLPLHGDEAYYWVWSRHPDLSYFDHPPMIAWMLGLATLLGSSELTVRLVPVLCMGLAAWLIRRLTFEIYGRTAAVLALIIFLVLPATQMGAMLATPDAPVILFWSLALYAGYRAVFDGATGWYLLTGAAIGLALLSKYTAILFPAAMLAFLLARRPNILLRGRAWLAVALALAIFAPVLVWNYRHDWVSFAFQYGHGSSADGGIHWGEWGEFLAGTFMAFSPVLFAIAIMAALEGKTLRDDRRLFVAAFMVLPLAFFAYKGLYKKMELNWVTIAFPAATVMVAGFISERRLWKSCMVGLVLALALSLAIKFPEALDLPANWNIQNRLAGYREAARALLQLRRPGEPLLADHYTTASLLGFYAPDHPLVRIPMPNRFSQYDLWSPTAPTRRPHGLYLASADEGDALNHVCGSAALLRVFSFLPPKGASKTFYFYRCGA